MELYNSADPLTDHLNTVLLPEMELTACSLEVAVECLRHLSARAIACSAFPTPGGISITLLAPPTCIATPINLRVTLGMTIMDGLVALGQASGLCLVLGNLGVMFCPSEWAALAAQPWKPSEQTQAMELPGTLSRDDRLRLVAFYPVLAISSHPLRSKWMAAFLASDRTPQSAYTLANSIVGTVEGDPVPALTQIPMYLPDVGQSPFV